MPDIETLREDCWITSVDGCSHCGDSYCDGIGCIAALDPDDEVHHAAIESLHESLRQAQAWTHMHDMIANGVSLGTAYIVASEALIHSDNRMVDDDTRAWFRTALSGQDESALVDTLWPADREDD